MTLARNFLGAAIAAPLLSSCASFDLSHEPKPVPVTRMASQCVEWIAGVDKAVSRAAVTDAGAYRVPGFPYLRVDRFTASFAEQALTDEPLFDAWARHARALDREGRSIELLNLPPAGIAEIGVATREAASARTESCADELLESDLANPRVHKLMVANSRVPDDYLDLNRVVGLYPLAHPIFAAGVGRWHAEAVDAFRGYSENKLPRPDVVRYAPFAGQEQPLSQNEAAALIAQASRDPLGRILPGPVELERLFAAYAPVFEVEMGGEFDAIGALAWGNEAHPSVETARPLVYRRLAFTRYGGKVLPQLVYTAWFPERPGISAIDILAGKLDGMVFRVTLSADGTPLVYDSIHPCGCYHMFFPSARVRELPSPRAGDEWSFVPAPAPVPQAGQRVILHVQSRTHYLTGISVGAANAQISYLFEDENSLRSLPLPGGGNRSIYAPDGLVTGSERPERMLFWPMGVPSAGTMRQWGHAATAFLGRRHFDDANLLDRRFAPAP
jgi:hypothetical protein